MGSIQEYVRKNGSVSYWAKVRLKGNPTETASFKRKTDAKRWIANTESAIQEGRYFKTSESRKRTLGETINRYLERVIVEKPKSVQKQTMQLEWWRSQLGAYALADITPAVISEHKDILKKEITVRGRPRSVATVNRYLAVLSHCFTIAVKEWGWAVSNPVSHVSKGKEPEGRTRFLSDEERGKLLQACKESKSEHLYLAVVLSLATGARQSEILSLRWSQIDFKRELIRLEKTKTGKPRTVPLKGLPLKLLRDRLKKQSFNDNGENKNALVFPGSDPMKPIYFRDAWEAALERAEIKDFRWHDLRHSAASYLIMNGADIREVAEILGHQVLQTTMRYSHLSEKHTAKVVESMNKKIFGNA